MSGSYTDTNSISEMEKERIKYKKSNIRTKNTEYSNTTDCTNRHMSLPYQSVLGKELGKEMEIPIFI